MIEIFAAIIISGSIASEVVKEKSYYGVPYAGKQCSCCSIGHRGEHKYHYYRKKPKAQKKKIKINIPKFENPLSDGWYEPYNYKHVLDNPDQYFNK